MSEEERKFLEIVDLKKGFGSGETRQEVLRGMNFSAVLCELFLAHILQLVAIYADISGIGAVNASDDIEQCRLS